MGYSTQHPLYFLQTHTPSNKFETKSVSYISVQEKTS